MRYILGFLLLAALVPTGAAAKVIGKQVDYEADGVVLKGYIAYNDAISGRHPGVIVVHEWWGHNEYARRRARMLTEYGYTALAVDMYGDGKQADHPDDAGKFAGAVRKNRDVALARFRSALKLLQEHPTVDPNRIAAIGYCFGGSVVLEMARSGMDVDAVASFHGSLGTGHPAQPGGVNARILVLNGADDPFVTEEEIRAFKEEMDAARVRYEFVSYPGAKHSFTNPDADAFGERFNLPLAYDAHADRESWTHMLKFFRETFQD